MRAKLSRGRNYERGKGNNKLHKGDYMSYGVYIEFFY